METNMANGHMSKRLVKVKMREYVTQISLIFWQENAHKTEWDVEICVINYCVKLRSQSKVPACRLIIIPHHSVCCRWND